MKRPTISYRWLVVVAGFILTLTGYAVRNTFTVFYPVIVEDFLWSRGVTAIMYSLTMVSYGIVAPVAGGLVDRFNPKLVFSAGGLIIGGGIALCSLATSTWHFYLFYGVMVATGLSMVGFTPLTSILTHWFLEKRALVFGLLGAGYGVSLISAPLFQYVITEYGWRTAYVITGTAAASIIIPLAVFVIKRKPDTGHRAQATAGESNTTADKVADAAKSADWTIRSALTTRTYKLQLAMSFLNIGFAQGVSVAHLVYFFRDAGFTPMTAASIFSLYGVGFVIGNLTSGLSDRFGRARIFVPTTLLAGVGIGMMYFVNDAMSPVVPSVGTLLLGYGLGICAPTCYASIADCFHGRNYGSIQGTAILVMSMGAAVGPWLGGSLHDFTGTYTTTFLLAQIALVLAALLMAIANPRADVPPR